MERRGEWFEIRPGGTIDDRDVKEMLMREIPHFPPKLLGRLAGKGGLKRYGDRILVHLFAPEIPAFSPEWREVSVLFEDDFCLVAHKPAGLAVHPSRSGEGGTLANAIAGYYEATGQACAVRHIHRLDTDTSGPVLYAKNDFAHSLLDEAMRKKLIERTYIAVVEGTVARASGRIEARIGRDRHHSGRRRVSAAGSPAATNYEVLERFSRSTLLRLHLESGRTHQIRVHLSHLGHPLLGDELYGGKTALISRQALHGERLVFLHPLDGKPVVVEDPWPFDVQKVIKTLRGE